jgi:hypothetical protein
MDDSNQQISVHLKEKYSNVMALLYLDALPFSRVYVKYNIKSLCNPSNLTRTETICINIAICILRP